jgi:anti-sigma B factor antagonist
VEIFEVSNPTPRTFEVRGELDMTTAPILLQAVGPSLRAKGDILFDLSDLSYIDSTGLRAIIEIAAPSPGGSVILASPQPLVQRAIEVSGLHRRTNIRLLPGLSDVLAARRRLDCLDLPVEFFPGEDEEATG